MAEEFEEFALIDAIEEGTEIGDYIFLQGTWHRRLKSAEEMMAESEEVEAAVMSTDSLDTDQALAMLEDFTDMVLQSGWVQEKIEVLLQGLEALSESVEEGTVSAESQKLLDKIGSVQEAMNQAGYGEEEAEEASDELAEEFISSGLVGALGEDMVVETPISVSGGREEYMRQGHSQHLELSEDTSQIDSNRFKFSEDTSDSLLDMFSGEDLLA